MYVETDKISVQIINKDLASKLITENHYTHKFSTCRYAFGVIYTSDIEHDFFSTNEEKIIGCASFGHPPGRGTAGSISPILDDSEVLELTRLWIADGYGKNIESYVLSECIAWLKQNTGAKALISYADPGAGHRGVIYQATNWLYQGTDLFGKRFNIRLSPDDEWIHWRTISSRFKTNNIEELKQKIGHDFQLKYIPQKHRYVYIIPSGRERKKILKNLKYPTESYPKGDIDWQEEILDVHVDNEFKIDSVV